MRMVLGCRTHSTHGDSNTSRHDRFRERVERVWPDWLTCITTRPAFWAVATLYTLGAALIIGVPTRLIPNSLFMRLTPTSPRDYLIWGVTVALFGPLLASSTLYPVTTHRETGRQIGSGDLRTIAGGMLSFLSVGCPMCDNLVVLALGVSSTPTVFDPLRPFLGVAAIFTLASTLFLRFRTLRNGCPLPERAAAVTHES